MSAAPEAFSWHLRPMRYADLKAVMAVEKSAYLFPWTEGIMRDCIRVGYCCRVLEAGKRIDGHGVMSMAAGEAHILNICIRPARQGQGLARYLLAYLLDLARANAIHTAFLEVRPSNGRALRLYHSAGFCEVGVRRNYYPDDGRPEDALVMAKDL